MPPLGDAARDAHVAFWGRTVNGVSLHKELVQDKLVERFVARGEA